MDRSLAGGIAVVLGLTVGDVAFAFDSGVHPKITRRILEECRLGPNEDFVGGTENEDAAFKTRLTRGWNWHYARNEFMAEKTFLARWDRIDSFVPSPVPFRTNLDHVFNVRVRQLHEAAEDRACDASDIWEKGGRVTHFLEDMRVPAHVIPVDHGALADKDEFDDGRAFYSASVQRRACDAGTSLGAAAVVPADIRQHLNAALDHTRAWIKEPVDGKSTDPRCRWSSLYYCLPGSGSCTSASHQGFGGYTGVRLYKESEDARRCNAPPYSDDYKATLQPAFDGMVTDVAFMFAYVGKLVKQCEARKQREAR